MDKATGGAKPKTATATATNNNNSNSRQGGASGSSGSQTSRAQPRNRSPRRENGYAARSTGGGVLRGVRGGNAGSEGSGHTTTRAPTSNHTATSDNMATAASRRSSGPTSVARTRNSSSTQTRSTPHPIPHSHPLPRLHLNEYSPLRGGRSSEGRSVARQNDFRRPVLRHRHPVPRNVEPSVLAPLESPSRDLPPSVSPSLHGICSNSEDSDSDSGSPMSPPSYAHMSASMHPLSASQGVRDRPLSMSRDAVVARELLQAEMDVMLQRDEEMARQLQEEYNHHDDQPFSPLARPLSMFLPGGLQARGRHYPSIPGRMEGGPRPRGRDRRMQVPMRLLGPDRGGLEPLRVGRAMRLLMGGHRAGMMPGPGEDMGLGSESGLSSPDHDGSLPSTEFDPEERLLAGGLEPPDDFLSMMNDPSLMLLMLLLRAPDTLNHNEAGVDLDDYEGLWELAERLGEVRRRGITEEQINSLPTLKFKPHSGEASAASAASANAPGSLQCQICLVDFEHGDCLRCIPCKHDFHKDCIDEWLKRNATCPICRQDVRPSDK